MVRAEDLFFDLKENESIIALSYIFNTGVSGVIANKNRILTEDEFFEYKKIINKRKKGLPIQYAIGKWNFYGRDFIVDSRALIPRPETEGLVEWVISDLSLIGYNICDMGTGAGIIPITILAELENENLNKIKIENITGIDISEKAISLAEENDRFVLNSELQGRINWIKSDLFENVNDKFDIIISNPPYVEDAVKLTLQEELSYEPQNALFAGIDGLDIYKRLFPQCMDRLNFGGAVYLEIGDTQGESVKKLLIENGFRDIEIKKDMTGRDRYVKALK